MEIGKEQIPDDEALMTRFCGGDDEAFGELFQKYSRALVNFIFRFTGNGSEAEDLANEVFLRIYKIRDRYRPEAKFTTLLYGIARNISIDCLRKKKCLKFSSMEDKKNGDEAPAQFGESESNPQNLSEKEDREVVVRAAVNSLPENQKTALILKVYEDRPYSEIAEIMGVSRSSVESLLFRARENLKKKLKFQ